MKIPYLTITVFVCLIVLEACSSYKSRIYATNQIVKEAESSRIKQLEQDYATHQISNAAVWENQRGKDSVYLLNRDIAREYVNILLTYSIGISDYRRVIVLDSIIASCNFKKADTLHLLETINVTYPKLPTIAFWKSLNNVRYVGNSTPSQPFKNFCSSFIYKPPNEGKLKKAISFDKWIVEMLRNPFVPLKSREEVYLYTVLVKQGKSFVTLQSIVFMN